MPTRTVRWSNFVGSTLIAASVAAMSGCAGSSSSAPANPDAAPGAPGNTVSPPGVPTGPTGKMIGQAAPATPGVPAAKVSAAQDAASPIPRNARYTIVVMGFSGPSHVQQATVSKNNLITGTGKKDFYVVHDDSQSTIYYGYYRERERSVDATEAARAAKDLEFVRNIGDAEGHRLFGQALVVPLPTPDVAGPVQWDLAQLNNDRADDDPDRPYWSIAIADYSNDVIIDGMNRKQIVVEAVQEARKRGYEAYYYNGPHTSTVCIGAWPQKAVRMETEAAHTAGDTGQELFVSTHPLTKDERDSIEQTGRDIKIVEPKVFIDDPSLQKAFNTYKEYSLNGRIEMTRTTDPHTGKVTEKPKDTFLIQIPTAPAKSMLARDNRTDDAAGQQTTAVDSTPTVLNPLGPGGNGAGKLRSVQR